MGKVEEAHADVAEAAREAPGDKAVQQHLQVVGREFRELKKKEREAARTLWQGKLKQEEGADTTEEKKTKEKNYEIPNEAYSTADYKGHRPR